MIALPVIFENNIVILKKEKMSKILEELKIAFNIEKNNYGIESVREQQDTYHHVILELNTFTLGDFDFKKCIEIASKYGYGFYLTPRIERKSNARHVITFHK
jgi:hypothetical protein